MKATIRVSRKDQRPSRSPWDGTGIFPGEVDDDDDDNGDVDDVDADDDDDDGDDDEAITHLR